MKTLTKANAPKPGEAVGERNGPVSGGETITIPVTSLVKGNGPVTVILMLSGNDVWFGSSESGKGPELVVVAEDPGDH